MFKRCLMVVALVSTTLAMEAEAPKKARFIRNPDAVPNEYVVIFNDDFLEKVNGRFDHSVMRVSDELMQRVGGRAHARWANAIRGFAAHMNEAQALALQNDPRVKVIEENARLIMSASPQPTGADLRALDRLDDYRPDEDFSGAMGDGSYVYNCDGQGIRVYVVDSGIWAQHPEFITNGVSRVTAGVNFAPAEQSTTSVSVNLPNAPCDGSPTYPNGSHGTMVASAIGGNTYGAAKGATLVPVRVVNCSAEVELVHMINGLNWIQQDYALYSTPAVVNISGGQRVYDALYGYRRPSDVDPTLLVGCWSSGAGISCTSRAAAI